MCEWAREEKGFTRSAQRKSTEVADKNEIDSPDGLSTFEFGVGAGD